MTNKNSQIPKAFVQNIPDLNDALHFSFTSIYSTTPFGRYDKILTYFCIVLLISCRITKGTIVLLFQTFHEGDSLCQCHCRVPGLTCKFFFLNINTFNTIIHYEIE